MPSDSKDYRAVRAEPTEKPKPLEESIIKAVHDTNTNAMANLNKSHVWITLVTNSECHVICQCFVPQKLTDTPT